MESEEKSKLKGGKSAATTKKEIKHEEKYQYR